MSELWIFISLVITLAIPTVTSIALIYLFFLVVKALKAYIRSQEGKPEYAVVKKTLGQTIKYHRENNGMTQEFVAESLGISRQAVSKWENGVTDPSTSNLLALAKLFNISPEEMLNQIKL